MQSSPRLALRSVLAALLFAPAAPVALRAADFPPVTDAERALQSVPGEPNAPAVVLGKSAELWLMDLARQEISSRLVSRVRIKVLSEQGMSQGEVEIPHSSFVRLVKLDGRTVLPDGRVVPLPKDARFERRLSKAEKLYVTSVAFPAVEVGAILDYEYELRFDSLYFLEPWFLSDELPLGVLVTARLGGPAPDGAWTLVVDDEDRPQGWLAARDRTDGQPVTAEHLVPGGSLYDVTSGSLRSALDAALSSPSGQGVAVDGDGRVVGSVSADDVLAALAAARSLTAA